MKCRQIKRQISVLQDGELDPEQEKTLMAHLRQCESCRTLRQEYCASWDLLEMLEGAEPNPYFYTRLKTRLDGQPGHYRRFDRFLIPVTAAAMLLLGIWMGSAMTKNGNAGALQAESEPMIPALENFEDFEDFPAESIGKVFTDVAVLR